MFALVTLVLVDPGRATFAGADGLVVFTVPGVNVPSRLLSIDPRTGSSTARAAAEVELSQAGAWSPDGSRLAFVRVEPGDPRDGDVPVVYVSTTGGVSRVGMGDRPAWSPDGRRLAFYLPGKRGGVFVFNLRTGRTQRVARFGGPPVWSPDGRLLAYGTSRIWGVVRGLWEVRAAGGPPRRVLGGVSAIEPPAWSPDGRRIVFVDYRTGSLRLLDQATGRARLLARPRPGPPAGPAWSPKGDELAYLAATGLHLIHADGSHDRLLAPIASPETASLAWSPAATGIALVDGSVVSVLRVADGRRRLLQGSPHQTFADVAWPAAARIVIAAGRKTQQVAVVQPDGSARRLLTSGPWWDSGPRWSPDGRTIAFASDRDGDDELYLMNADGSDVRQLTHNHVEDTAPSWSSDGRRLALTSDRGGSQAIWTINSDGSGARRFPSAGTVAGTSPVWSPDGRWIAYGRVDEHSAWTATTVIADARTGATGCTAGGIPFAWSPDSRQLQLRPNQLGEAATVDACRPGPVSTPSVAPFLWAPDGAGTIACAPFSTADGCDADWQPLPTTTSVR